MNRSVPISWKWIGKAVLASSIAGFAATWPSMIYDAYGPSHCVHMDWISCVVMGPMLGIPSALGALLGRYWLLNFLAISLVTVPSLMQGYRTDAAMQIAMATLAAGTMSCLAGAWSLVKTSDRP